MALGVEQGSYIGVPVEATIERPGLEARFYFRYLSDDRIEVHHPFHSPVVLGDSSSIEVSAADKAAVVLFQRMPYLIDSMKLNRTRRYETRLFAGEYSQLSHCFSLGMFGQDFGGGPLDIIDGFFNDASQIYDGHQGDDNYQGHGFEDLHDKERANFFQRAGILDAMEEAGAIKRHASGLYVAKTRLNIDRLLDEDEVVIRRSFLSNKHPSRRLDADRFQYNEEERLLISWAVHKDMSSPGRVPLALAKLSIDSIARKIILVDDEGDQLVFTDSQAALQSAMDYAEHNSEHWCEPVQDLVNDILNLAERYFFVCDHPYARSFHYFYPRDYLHTSASLMFAHFKEVAKDDRAMAWFLQTAERIARDQSKKSVLYERNTRPYRGPNPPEGVELRKLKDGEAIRSPACVKGEEFTIVLPPGRVRTINPRVLNGGADTVPLSNIFPEFDEFCQERHRWIGTYQAEIDMPDPEDREAVASALERINDEWNVVLARRPHMPPTELQRTIQEANDYVLKVGKLALAS